MRAISIRQPWADSVIDGKKIWEYRTIPTNIRGRVYVYASQKKVNTSTTDGWRAWANGGFKENLPLGRIIGTVEITDCEKHGEEYRWRLKRPKRFKRTMKPKNHPQPVFFNPF